MSCMVATRLEILMSTRVLILDNFRRESDHAMVDGETLFHVANQISSKQRNFGEFYRDARKSSS